MTSEKSGIYCIENLINGKLYIGSAINLRKRRNKHFSELNRNIHGNPHLQNSYNKYGEENFKFSVLEYVKNSKDLIEREQSWIDSLNWDNLYNICPTAGNSLGIKLSKEHRRKLSKIFSGKRKPNVWENPYKKC